jgi:glycosyltransferase involved in cell wall biosynthesis
VNRRVLVVSHPAVLEVNQEVYAGLLGYGWDVRVVTPAHWQHEYARKAFPAEVHGDLAGRVIPTRVALRGRPQRHVYLARVGRILDSFRPTVVFLEQEPFSLVAAQWLRPLRVRSIPFGIQHDENLERVLPAVARAVRRRVTPAAAFIAARSPRAAELITRDFPDARCPIVPHPIPEWATVLPSERTDSAFVVGYAGRLVAEKGVDDLIRACANVADARVLLVGNGPERDRLESLAGELGVRLTIDDSVTHQEMAGAYARMDVLVLPSRTTPTWAEQFGRVLVEAGWCGVPVVGSSSGEIPWVISQTGGGHVFPEGDPRALAAQLERLRDDPDERRRLGEAARVAVAAGFTTSAGARLLHEELTSAVEGPAP